MANVMGQSSGGITSIVTNGRPNSNLIDALAATIMAKLLQDSPLSDESCIFKVPQLLRRHNPEAFQPQVVSIGPLHQGGEKFKPLEIVKRRYLQNFLISNQNIGLINLIEKIIGLEKRARLFYAEPLDHISESDFMEMLILDGCFIIELFRKSFFEDKKFTDPIFNMICMFQHICNDLLLLENQLPWFVLESLYSLMSANYPSAHHLDVFILTVFTTQKPLVHNCSLYLKHLGELHPNHRTGDKALHILDLVRTSIVFSFQKFSPTNNKNINHFWTVKPIEDRFGTEIPSATTLSEAGVKFQRGINSQSIMNIEFRDGVLTIPPLEIGELTEPLFRNLIAFEQCYHGRSDEITSYAAFMKKLLGSSKDMHFLCEAKIIGNWLSDEDGFHFFNKLYNDTALNKFFYEDLCVEVNSYYEVAWNAWKATLKREHFDTPWKIISLIAGIMLLILTAVQAAYSVHK